MSGAAGEPIGAKPSPGEYHIVISEGSRRGMLAPFASWQGAVLAVVIALIAWRAAARGLLWLFVVVVVVTSLALAAVLPLWYSHQARRLPAGARVLCYVRRRSPEDSWNEVEPLLRAGALLVDMGELGLHLCPNDGSSCTGGLVLRRYGVGVAIHSTVKGKAVEATLFRNGVMRRIHASGRLPKADRMGLSRPPFLTGRRPAPPD